MGLCAVGLSVVGLSMGEGVGGGVGASVGAGVGEIEGKKVVGVWIVGRIVVGLSAVGLSVVGSSVVGLSVVGLSVVGLSVTGVVGAGVTAQVSHARKGDGGCRHKLHQLGKARNPSGENKGMERAEREGRAKREGGVER